MKELYSEELIEHYKHPHRFGKMDKPNLVGKAVNELCGDELTFYVKEKNGKVQECTFEGSGCAICLGTMSMLIDEQIGKEVTKVKKQEPNTALERIGMDPNSSRRRCATLAIEVMNNLSSI